MLQVLRKGLVASAILMSWVAAVSSAGAQGVPPAPAKVIFIPGIMGSTLTVDGEVIWGEFGREVSMRFDADHLADATPLANASFAGIEQVVYGDFFASLSRRMDVEPNFALFSYDWRASNVDSAAKLNDELCKQDDPGEPVVLAAHSMGGLVLKHWLRLYYGKLCGDKPAVNVAQIAFIATPHFGAPKSVQSMFFGEKLFDDPLINRWLVGPLNRDGVTFDSLYELFPASHAYEGARLQGGVPCYSTVSESSKNRLRYRVYYKDERGESAPLDIFSAGVMLNFSPVAKKFETLGITEPAAYLQAKLDRARKNICALAGFEMPSELVGRIKYYVGTQTIENMVNGTLASVIMSRALPRQGLFDFMVDNGVSEVLLTTDPGPGDGTVPQNMAYPDGVQPLFISGVDHLGILSSPTFAEYLEIDRQTAAVSTGMSQQGSLVDVVATSAGITSPEDVERISVFSDLWDVRFVDTTQLASTEGQALVSRFVDFGLGINPLGSEAARQAAEGTLATADDIYLFAKNNPSADNWLFAASSAGLSDVRRSWALNNAAMDLYRIGRISESKALFDELKDRASSGTGVIQDSAFLATLYNNAGWANLRLQDFDAARSDLETALQYDPGAQKPQQGIANLERQLAGGLGSIEIIP